MSRRSSTLAICPLEAEAGAAGLAVVAEAGEAALGGAEAGTRTRTMAHQQRSWRQAFFSTLVRGRWCANSATKRYADSGCLTLVLSILQIWNMAFADTLLQRFNLFGE